MKEKNCLPHSLVLNLNKLLLFSFFFVFFSVSFAEAATWQWTPMENRDRISMQFDQSVAGYSMERASARVLALELPYNPPSLEQEGTALQGNLLNSINSENNTVYLNTDTAAFGYIVSQPSPTRLVIDLYPDPLGARFVEDTEAEVVSNVALDDVGQNISQEGTNLPLPEPNLEQNQTVLPVENSVDNTIPTPEPVIPTPEPVIPTPEPVIPNPPVDSIISTNTTGNTTTTDENIENNPTAPINDQLPSVLPLPEIPPMPMGNAAEANLNLPANPPLVESSASSFVEQNNGFPAAEPYFGHSFTAPLSDAQYNTPAAIPQPRQVLGANDVEAPEYKGKITQEFQQSSSINNITNTLDASAHNSSQNSSQNVTESTTQNNSINSNPLTPLFANNTLPTPSPVQGALEELSQNLTASELPENSTVENTNVSTDTGNITENLTQNLTQNQTEALGNSSTHATAINAADVFPYNALLASNSTTQLPLPEAIAQNKTVIFQDKEGNIVPPPPNIPQLLTDMRTSMQGSTFANAITAMETLKELRLDSDLEKHKELREEVLYNYMNALYRLNEVNLVNGINEILAAATEAINFNPKSPRVPEALYIQAITHLKSGNQEEAKGFALLLRRQHPDYLNVPSLLFQLGEDQFKKGQYADAAITFNYIVQDYPDTRIAKEAAYFLAQSYYKQGHYDQALTVIDFVNLRWPNVYLEVPDYLSMSADVQISQGRLEDAVKTLWVQYNLDPESASTPDTLTKLAELYYVIGNKEAATKVQTEILTRFPDTEHAPLALLRLGENAMMQTNPSLDEILALFEEPNPRIPAINYQEIIDTYPNSSQVPSAKTRLAAWSFRNKDYPQALEQAQEVIDTYLEYPQFNVALDILLQAFSQDLTMSLAEENFDRVLTLWEKYPIAQPYYLPLEADLRVAIARGYLNRGNEAEGLALLEPFIDYFQDPKYGLYVYNLFLAHYLKNLDWNGILDLGEKVDAWNMPLDLRNQHDYTIALAAENIGLSSSALPLWEKLAPNENIPLYQRAYATYFLARDAERKQDLRAIYQYNLDALAMFQQLIDERSSYADSGRLSETIAALMDVTEAAGRYAESLEWLNRYALYVPPDSPSYAGLRFREARLYRKMGDMNRWQVILEDIVRKEPDSVFGKMAASELNTEKVARDINRFIN